MQSFSKTTSKIGGGCLSVATLFLATACSNLGDSNVTMSGQDDADVQNVKQSKRVEYFCDNNQALSVEYYKRGLDRSDGHTGINLRYQNREFEMYSSYAASGEKYATEQGLNPEDGLMWWSTGEGGRLITMILDDSVTAADYPIITTCKTKGRSAFRQ